MATTQGTIFEVKRFAVHDGPGVRTTLFLKGCSLRCRWCHNPEGIEPQPELAHYPQKCLDCGECVEVCPHEAHALVDGRHVFEREKCVVCGRCVEVCLGRALRVFGRNVSVDEARQIVLEDRDFYRDGGGCTLSGGEPLLQAGFCAALCERLHADGIHCAIDTSGAVPRERFEAVLPFADLFLYDLKQVDDSRHREGTGASNHRILENLRRLSASGTPIETRVPLIPGFNDAPADLQAMGKFLSGLHNIVAVRLLPYHDLARSKFAAIGRPDTMPHVPVPDAAALAAAAATLAESGVANVLVPAGGTTPNALRA